MVALTLAVLAALGAGYGLGHHRPGEPSGAHAVKGGTACSTALDYPGARRALARVSPGGRYGNTQFSSDGVADEDLEVDCAITLDGNEMVHLHSNNMDDDRPKISFSAWQSTIGGDVPRPYDKRGVPVDMGSPAVSFPVEAGVRVLCRHAYGHPRTRAFKVTAFAESGDPTLRQDLVTLDAALARYVFRVARCEGPSLIPGHAPRVTEKAGTDDD
jgi:hypothetical protein